jgi:hypothetical protein
MKFTQLQTISDAIATQDRDNILNAIDSALLHETGPHWIRDLGKLKQFILDGKPVFTVFAKDGNSKLPFLAFSSLPGENHCPGAGECLKFCYSFRAWRYPAAFCRQAQNSVLMQTNTGFQHIIDAIDQHKPDIAKDKIQKRIERITARDDDIAGKEKYRLESEANERILYRLWSKLEKIPNTIDFRLYVDGDFSSAGNVLTWMNILENRAWLNAYGYSKSWEQLLDYAKETGNAFPSNYLLNLSSGSKHTAKTKDKIKQLNIVRGEFIAVNVGYNVKSSMHNNRAHKAKLRQLHDKASFQCPGKCGTCTSKGHACGSDRFKGLDIIIAVH